MIAHNGYTDYITLALALCYGCRIKFIYSTKFFQNNKHNTLGPIGLYYQRFRMLIYANAMMHDAGLEINYMRNIVFR